MVTFVMAVCLLAVVSGSAQAARARVQPGGVGYVVTGYSFTFVDMLRYWKDGFRFQLKH